MESSGAHREMLSSFGMAKTTWLLSESVTYSPRERWGQDGGTIHEENSDQQFLEEIVDLAEVWVISSGLGSVVPTQIHLGSACGGSLVYHLPQMVLWWEENRGEENRGEGWGPARHGSTVARLSHEM